MRRGTRSVVALMTPLAIVLASCSTQASPTPTPSTSGSSPPGISIEGETPAEIYPQLAELAPAERDAYILERARQEGQLLLYTVSQSAVVEARIAAFSEQYPDIDVQFVGLEDSEIYDRVALEARAGRGVADIIETSGLGALAVKADDLVADHYGIPIPDEYPEDAVGDWWVVNGYNAQLIVWNTDLVSADEAPADYEDLLDPKWKGRIAVDAFPEDMVLALVSAWGPERTEEWLTKLLVDNEALLRQGSTNRANLLAAGEFSVASDILITTFIRLVEEQGAPLAWAAPDPTPVNTTMPLISATAKSPYAALLWISWLLSADGGARVDAEQGRIPINPNVQLKYPYLQDFITSGSAINDRLLVQSPGNLTQEVVDEANRIIEEIVVPRTGG